MSSLDIRFVVDAFQSTLDNRLIIEMLGSEYDILIIPYIIRRFRLLMRVELAACKRHTKTIEIEVHAM